MNRQEKILFLIQETVNPDLQVTLTKMGLAQELIDIFTDLSAAETFGVYERTFSEEEIDAMYQFNSSPVAVQMKKKMQSVFDQSFEVGERCMQEAVARYNGAGIPEGSDLLD